MLHGTLLKRRDHVPGWRPRHFVLQGAPDHLLLYYLPSPSDSPSNAPHHPPPRGLVPLGGASVRPLSEAEAGGVRHAFRIDHPWAPGVSRSKGWVLAARSRQEREKWVKVLKRGVAEAEEGLRREEEAAAEEQGQQQNEHGGDGVGQEGQEQEEAPAAALAVGEGASVPLEQLVLPVSELCVWGGVTNHIIIITTTSTPFPPQTPNPNTQGYEEATASAVRTLLEFAEPSDGWRLNFERRGVRAYKRERVGTLGILCVVDGPRCTA